jgi:hypothetical protein
MTTASPICAATGALVVVVTRSERTTSRSTLGAELAPQPAATALAAMARDNKTTWPRRFRSPFNLDTLTPEKP